MKIRKHRIKDTVLIGMATLIMWVLYSIHKDFFGLAVVGLCSIAFLLMLGNVFHIVNLGDDFENGRWVD